MTEQDLIPKIIHFFWFGNGKKNEIYDRCRASWEKFAPDYEIIEWGEENCDINEIKFVRQAYDAKKWAFVSDYFRLKKLYEFGGFYVDTDTEFNQSIDSLRKYTAVFPFENKTDICAGFIACRPGNKIIKEVLDTYTNYDFVASDGSYNTKYNIVVRITETLARNYPIVFNGRTQEQSDGTIIFSPNILMLNVYDGSNITEHHYEASWWDPSTEYFSYKNHLLKSYFESSAITNAPSWKRAIYFMLFEPRTFRRKLAARLSSYPKLFSFILKVYKSVKRS